MTNYNQPLVQTPAQAPEEDYYDVPEFVNANGDRVAAAALAAAQKHVEEKRSFQDYLSCTQYGWCNWSEVKTNAQGQHVVTLAVNSSKKSNDPRYPDADLGIFWRKAFKNLDQASSFAKAVLKSYTIVTGEIQGTNVRDREGKNILTGVSGWVRNLKYFNYNTEKSTPQFTARRSTAPQNEAYYG